ncbi:ABC transporter ATP-binding protein [Rickettsia endosymbiont of Halotydeus destructor]|uniref:ABC transporter ATP-binding protein n=1 Tax=Rickettsia endosymbiont of Halotydeus destructor TaxID=2996754 RepID=UPI003BB0111C
MLSKPSNIFIKIANGYVEGIDTHKRAQGLKHFFLGKGELFSLKIPILNNINFSCYEGEKIAFIGSNGSSKSSLLKVIAGIYPLKSGKIKVHGNIAAIIDMGVGFEPEQTGRENIKMLMLYNNMLDKYSKSVEQEIIEFSGLGSKIDLLIKNYSSGMLSRLAFSVSIFQNPQILLLDEVFAAGDKYFIEKSLKLMKNKFKNTPISIIVSHEEDIIKDNCNRCILLQEGSIVADGSPNEIFKIFNREIHK